MAGEQQVEEAGPGRQDTHGRRLGDAHMWWALLHTITGCPVLCSNVVPCGSAMGSPSWSSWSPEFMLKGLSMSPLTDIISAGCLAVAGAEVLGAAPGPTLQRGNARGGKRGQVGGRGCGRAQADQAAATAG